MSRPDAGERPTRAVRPPTPAAALTEYARLVRATRRHQAEYFRLAGNRLAGNRHRSAVVLAECKDLERRLDGATAAILDGVRPRTESMFGAEPSGGLPD